jgi:2-aminoadipate transaminase
MPQNWTSRFSDNVRGYGGYSIGKLFKLLNDPEIISLAGGLPSPDTFLTNDLQRVSQIRLQEDADTIMQYTDITGEMNLIEAVIQ